METHNNFRKLTLRLFEKDIEIVFSENVGQKPEKISGKLVGRIWGEKYIENKIIDTVIALIVLTSEGEVEVACKDIISISELEF